MGRGTDEPIALETFVREHGLELTRFAYLLTGDRGRGEDLVQDVLFAMYRRFGTVITVADPRAYARRCAVNAHVSRWRRRRVVELLSEELPDQVSEGGDAAEPGDEQLWTAVLGLPDRQRAVVVLRYYVGESDRHIAELLGCQESSVRSLAARAFKSLRPAVRPSTASSLHPVAEVAP